MKWPWQFSDDEYVNRVERQLQWHRRVGVFMAVMSAVFVGCGVYFLNLLQTGSVELFNEPLSQVPFQIGVVLGFVGGKIVFFALFAFFSGLYWYFAGRKDRLLVAYHRRLIELDELPLKSSEVAV